jgi:hypothetical protein
MTGKAAVVLLLIACGHHEQPMFRCRKTSSGANARTCMGPGPLPKGASQADTFAVDAAWCITRRVSFANSRTRMECAQRSPSAKAVDADA